MYMNLKNYTFSFGAHNGSDVIWIHFPNLNQLKIDLKNSFPSAKWSNTNKAWYLPDRKSVRAVLQLPEKNSDDKLSAQLSEENSLAFKKYMQQLTLKAYSDNTVNSYNAICCL